MILVRFHGKPFNITVIQVYAPTTNAQEAEQFYEDLQDLLELTQKKKSFSSQKLECQRRKSTDTWSDRQVWPWSTKLSRAKAYNFAKRKTPSSNNTRDNSTNGHHQIVNTEIRLFIFFADKDGEPLYS